MKTRLLKTLLIGTCLFYSLNAVKAGLTNVCESVQIPLTVVIDDHELSGGGPKCPVLPPAVYLDGHSLYFGESYADAVPVELRDASGNVVYSDYLPAGVQTLSLPTTLSGTYTLYIYMDNYIFAGQINL